MSDGVKDVYKNELLIEESNLYVTPNGVNTHKFKTRNPKYPDRSLYLAKIDYRKRQSYVPVNTVVCIMLVIMQTLDFDTSNNYLGEWSVRNIYIMTLTNYGNLVLLSDGEAHPLVCLEAFAAGLGVVVM